MSQSNVSSPSAPPQLNPRRRGLFLAAILVIALLLRLHDLGRHSFWLDEILTVQLSVGRGYAHLDFPQDRLIELPVDLIDLNSAPPFWRIWTSLDRDVHPPLYYLVLRAWREVFGDGDVAIRMLSVMLSLVAIAMLYLAVKQQFGDAPALWACALMALAGPQIEYAQENRSYVLLLAALLGAAAAIVTVEKFGPSRARCAALGAALLAAALTHYAAFPALGCLFAYVLIRLRRRVLAWTLVAFAISAAIFLFAWGPFWLEQMRGFGDRIGFSADRDTSVLATLRSAAELPLRFFTDAAIRPRWVGLLSAMLYVLPPVLIVTRRRFDLLLWWMWLAGYVLFVALSDLARGGHALELIRYTLAASPAAYVLVTGMLSDARVRWQRHVVPGALVVACLAALPAPYARQKADWRGLAQFFESRVSADDVIVVHSTGPDDWRARCLYLCLRYYAPRPPLPVAFIADTEAQIIEQLQARDAWLLAAPHMAQEKPLLPGWRAVEMDADPLAGTVTWLQPEGRRVPRDP